MLLWLAGCYNNPSNPAAGRQVNAEQAHPDSLFDFQKYKALFRHKNELSFIPLWSDSLGESEAPTVIDSNTLKSVYQDDLSHYFPAEVGSGNQFYGYIDTFSSFNLVCMYTGRGDAGDVYDLLTYTKSGRRISYLEASQLQGEEDVWELNQRAVLTGDRIKIYATACRTTFDTTGVAVGSICDTFSSYYLIQANGIITLQKKDSVLSPTLDSLRKAIPYN